MSDHDLRAATLTRNLVQRRADMKRLLGDKYEEQSKEARVVLVWYAKERNLDLMVAALAICKAMSKAGHDPSIIMAALVDELEVRNG